MRKTQTLFFWLAAAWLVVSTSLIVAHAPWGVVLIGGPASAAALR